MNEENTTVETGNVTEQANQTTVKMYTEDEFNRKLTAEVDRRVESGIQKGLETQREKWEREAREKATLTAEELAQKKIEEKSNELTAKEKEIAKRANRIDAKELLSEADIPKSHYDKFLDVLISEDADVTLTNVKNFIEMFNSTKKEIETKVKSELSTVQKPTQGEANKISKADFVKMGYAEKVKFKTEHPDLYKEFMK